MFPNRVPNRTSFSLLKHHAEHLFGAQWTHVSQFIYWLENNFFPRLLSLSKGSYHEPLREQNKESQLPAPKVNSLSTQSSVNTKTVSKLDRTSLSSQGSSHDSGIMEGKEIYYQGDAKHNSVHPIHPPSIHSGEPTPSDSHPFPHSMDSSFSA